MNRKINNSILFSIITPVYNREDFIATAIKSVLNQSYHHWEYLIIDDGSEDLTRNVIQSFVDKRIRYFYQERRERSAARNLGIENATGEFVCFLDSDDYFLENHLKVLYDSVSHHGMRKGMYFTGAMYRDEFGLKIMSMMMNTEENPIHFVWEKSFSINSVCISKEILAKEKFDLQFSLWEDKHLWVRILLDYDFFSIPAYTSVAVKHTNNTYDNNKLNFKTIVLNRNCMITLLSERRDALEQYSVNFNYIDEILIKKTKIILFHYYRNRNYIKLCKTIWDFLYYTKNIKQLIKLMSRNKKY